MVLTYRALLPRGGPAPHFTWEGGEFQCQLQIAPLRPRLRLRCVPALLPRLSRALLSTRNWLPCAPSFPLHSAVPAPGTAGPANQQQETLQGSPSLLSLSQIFGGLFPILIHNQSDVILRLTFIFPFPSPLPRSPLETEQQLQNSNFITLAKIK